MSIPIHYDAIYLVENNDGIVSDYYFSDIEDAQEYLGDMLLDDPDESYEIVKYARVL